MKKRLALLLVLCISCLLTTCTAEEDIVGTWSGEYQGNTFNIIINADGTGATQIIGVNPIPMTGKWTLNKTSFVFKSDNGYTTAAEYTDGTLKLFGAGEEVIMTKNTDGYIPPEVNTNAALEDFNGKWIAEYTNTGGIVAPLGMDLLQESFSIENGKLIFTNSATMESLLGSAEIDMSFENGALHYTVEGNTPGLTVRIELLEDNMMSLTYELGSESVGLYLTKQE